MTTEDTLLRAIREHPEDDDVRLVYADWLEDHGRPERAEFIRVQIALAGLDSGDPDGEELRRRQQALRREHRDRWLRELPVLPEGVGWGEFRRGFVSEVWATSGPALLSSTDQILSAIPFRRLALDYWSPGNSLTGSALLASVRELVIFRDSHVRPSPPVDDAVLAEVLAWPELKRITHLRLGGLEVSERGLMALGGAELPNLRSLRSERYERSPNALDPIFEAPWLPQLEELEFVAYQLTGYPLCQLCKRLTPGKLRRLVLHSGRLSDLDATSFATAGLLGRLELLDLCRNGIGPTGTRTLVQALPPTCRLLLDENPLGDEGLRALAGSPLLARVSILMCRGGEIGDEGARAVAASAHAGRLTTINLNRHKLTTAGLQSLLTSPNLTALKVLQVEGNQIDALPVCQQKTLETLSVGHNRLGVSALAAFCADSHLPALTGLYLDGNQLSSAAGRALGASPSFPRLARLMLTGNPLGNVGADAVVAGPGLPALESLELQNCNISDAVLESWARSPRLRRLKRLNLDSWGNPISRQAYATFCAAAYQQGCDVDLWSRRPRLRSVRRPQHGTTLAADERTLLVRWIQQLWFAEYHTVGWLKATSFAELRRHADNPRDAQLAEQYQRGENVDDCLRRAMIRLFLSEWLMSHVPESVGVWGLPAEAFRPVSREEALALVDGIIAASLEDEEAGIRGMRPRYVIGEDAPADVFVLTGEEEQEDIPYDQLRTWFADELFDVSSASFFVHTAPGGPTVRFNHTQPRVIGMDRDIIGLLWLE